MISIIIPIYNAEKYLYECLDSVLNQTYKDFEVICVNDGSTDNSAEICQDFVDKDSRVHLFNQRNGGVSSARNRALKEAKGDYICFVDSDDMIEPHYLENLLDLAKNGAFAVCSYSRDLSKLTSRASHVTKYDVKEFIRHILNESIEHPNICMMLFKNSIIQTQHLDFTLGCVRTEDMEFYIKYLVHEKNVMVSDYRGYYYRDNEASAMYKFDKKTLSSIYANQRISELLIKEKIIDKNNLIVPACIQYFVYQTAKLSNKELYDYIHTLYDVKSLMIKMFKHPRRARKCVSFVYYILGCKGFFRLLSNTFYYKTIK